MAQRVGIVYKKKTVEKYRQLRGRHISRPRLAKSSSFPWKRCFSTTKSIFCQPGPLLCLFQLLLGLPELGQVEGGNLFGLLNLLLVSLDLLLQLAGQLSHPVLILLVLVDLERELLDLALSLLMALLVFSSSSLHIAKLRRIGSVCCENISATHLNLKLPNTALQLCHSSATTTVGGIGRLREPCLQLAQLDLHRVLGLRLGADMVLLGTELV